MTATSSEHRRPADYSARHASLPRRARWLLALVLAATTTAAATGATAGGVFTINDPWVRAAPGATSAEAFMELRSSDGATLVDVRSDSAAKVTIRSPGNAGKAIAELSLPAGVALLLAPGKYRFGLTGLAQPLKLGERVPLLLTVRGSDGSERRIPINAEVRKRSAVDDHLHHNHKH